MRFHALVIGLTVLFVFVGPLSPARAAADDADTCVHGAGDEKIAACTRAMNSGRWHGPGLAWAYIHRGNAYKAKRDLDHAIADYNEALRLDPTAASPYNNRGNAYQVRGDLDRAIADYNEAIRLDPKNALAYFNRANAYLAQSNFDRAIADFNEEIRLNPKDSRAYFELGLTSLYAGALSNSLTALNQASTLDPKDAYAALWLDIVGRRNKVSSHLSEAATKIDMTIWPSPVIRMFLGQMTSAAVLAAADDPDATKKKGQVCEANFYSGELALLQDAKDTAIRLLRLAAQDCPKSFTEWSATLPNSRRSARHIKARGRHNHRRASFRTARRFLKSSTPVTM